jgi:hypothetical protein
MDAVQLDHPRHRRALHAALAEPAEQDPLPASHCRVLADPPHPPKRLDRR